MVARRSLCAAALLACAVATDAASVSSWGDFAARSDVARLSSSLGLDLSGSVAAPFAYAMAQTQLSPDEIASLPPYGQAAAIREALARAAQSDCELARAAASGGRSPEAGLVAHLRAYEMVRPLLPKQARDDVSSSLAALRASFGRIAKEQIAQADHLWASIADAQAAPPETREVLRRVNEAADEAARRGEPVETRVLGVFENRRVEVQRFQDCAVRAWYNNAALRPVREVLDYETFLIMFARKTHEDIRKYGTSIEAQKKFLGEFGYELTEEDAPTEGLLLDELGRGAGGIVVSYRPKGKVRHQVVIQGAFQEHGAWRFVTTDSGREAPQVYDYSQLASLGELKMISARRVAGTDGSPLNDREITERARSMRASTPIPAVPSWAKRGDSLSPYAGAAPAAALEPPGPAAVDQPAPAALNREERNIPLEALRYVFGDRGYYLRTLRILSQPPGLVGGEARLRSVLKRVNAAADLEARTREPSGTRVVGVFENRKITRLQWFTQDCAVRAWYRNPALRPVREAVDYPTFLKLFEASAGKRLRWTGTPMEAEGQFLQKLGYEVRFEESPSEASLLEALRTGGSGFNLVLGWANPLWLQPFSGEYSGHQVVVQGAFQEGGIWHFVVTDSNFAAPQIYTYDQIRAFSYFRMATAGRVLDQGTPLSDNAVTERAKQLAAGLSQPAAVNRQN